MWPCPKWLKFRLSILLQVLCPIPAMGIIPPTQLEFGGCCHGVLEHKSCAYPPNLVSLLPPLHKAGAMEGGNVSFPVVLSWLASQIAHGWRGTSLHWSGLLYPWVMGNSCTLFLSILEPGLRRHCASSWTICAGSLCHLLRHAPAVGQPLGTRGNNCFLGLPQEEVGIAQAYLFPWTGGLNAPTGVRACDLCVAICHWSYGLANSVP